MLFFDTMVRLCTLLLKNGKPISVTNWPYDDIKFRLQFLPYACYMQRLVQ